MANWKKYLAEFLGTAILVAVACGTWVYTGNVVATAFAFGLVVVAMAYSIGSISGAHINPAVSLAVFISRKMGWKDFSLYVVAQIIGAIAGGAILFGLAHLHGDIAGGVHGYGHMAENLYEGITAPTLLNKIILAFVVEVFLTFVFVFTILGVTRKAESKRIISEDYSKIAGMVIGLTLVLVHLIGIGITGTSVNPARSIGSAVFAGCEALEQLWLFIVAPLVGASLAAACACILFKEKKVVETGQSVAAVAPAVLVAKTVAPVVVAEPMEEPASTPVAKPTAKVVAEPVAKVPVKKPPAKKKKKPAAKKSTTAKKA